jgi:hypothetical protein
MFTSKLFFCLVARGSLALTMMIPLVAGAQNAFSPGGPEYSILGGSVGDQTSPQVVVGPGGGWLVWQDNAADNSGLGIKIHKLNGYFNRTGSPIRVNYTTVGDQEKPQVAALTNGGAERKAFKISMPDSFDRTPHSWLRMFGLTPIRLDFKLIRLWLR